VSDLEVTLNRISPVPLYHQLSRQLVEAIESGRLPKGSFLDSEIDLAERWQVSRPTVRRAIQDLVDSGMLVRRRGVGTQVVSDQVRRPFKLTSLYEDLAATGLQPLTSVIHHARIGADRLVSEALGVAVDTEVVHIERVRSVGAQPLAILRNWLIVDAAGTITTDDLSQRGLYALLREHGVRPHSATQRLGAAAASAVDAGLLGLPVGAPLMTMRRVMHDVTGRIIELGDHCYDATQYTVELNVVETI
jgi:DNA-binding GntR family transcriptional regulator